MTFTRFSFLARLLAISAAVGLLLARCGAPHEEPAKDTENPTTTPANDGWVRTAVWPSGQPKREVLLARGDSVEVRVFHENGAVDRIGRYRRGVKTGVWQAFYPDGHKWSEHVYEAGVQTGAYRTWHPNGQLAIEGHYSSEGQPTGVWLFFDSLGNVQREVAGESLPLR